MYTYLPYADYTESAKSLEKEDLSKQLMYCVMILDTLHESDSSAVRAWTNHPIVSMWRGYEVQLAMYALDMFTEWSQVRGLDSENMGKRIQWHFETATFPDDFKMEKPYWMEDQEKLSRVLRTSRSLLIARSKNYEKLWPDTPHGLTPYYPRASGEE